MFFYSLSTNIKLSDLFFNVLFRELFLFLFLDEYCPNTVNQQDLVYVWCKQGVLLDKTNKPLVGVDILKPACLHC
mgnify:CR=1 FL=1